MNLRRFHNALRIMLSIDRHEMVAAGVLTADDQAGWRAFRENPTRWMIVASDEQKEGLFSIIEKRQPKPNCADLTSFKLPVSVEQMICVGGRGPVLVDDDGCQIAVIGPLLGEIGNGIAAALAHAVNAYPHLLSHVEQYKNDLTFPISPDQCARRLHAIDSVLSSIGVATKSEDLASARADN